MCEVLSDGVRCFEASDRQLVLAGGARVVSRSWSNREYKKLAFCTPAEEQDPIRWTGRVASVLRAD